MLLTCRGCTRPDEPPETSGTPAHLVACHGAGARLHRDLDRAAWRRALDLAAIPFRGAASIVGSRCPACGLAWSWRHHGHGFSELESQFVVWRAARQRLCGCGLEKLVSAYLASDRASPGPCDPKSRA